jgi:hypothetical protein
MEENMAKLKFPRTLYKRDENGTQDFTNAKHRHIMYDSVIVHNEEEMDEAEDMGYIDSFHDALFGIEDF